jgi:hypothetical protein
MRLTRILKAVGLGALAALFTTGCNGPAFTTCYAVMLPREETSVPADGTSVPADVREEQIREAIEKGIISPETALKLDRADDKER